MLKHTESEHTFSRIKGIKLFDAMIGPFLSSDDWNCAVLLFLVYIFVIYLDAECQRKGNEAFLRLGLTQILFLNTP